MSKIDPRISVVIMTVDRPKNYLHKLMSRLPDNLPIRLVVGSPSYRYLERYRRIRSIEMIGIEPAEWEQIKGSSVEHRASWNYWRCFTYGVRPGCNKGLLLLEDDIIPVKGWERLFSQAIAQIEVDYGDEYVLALYTAFTGLPEPSARGARYTRYPARAFANTQAMYYPEPVCAAFAEYLKREGVESFRIAYDRLLSVYLGISGTPLFATSPCLVQHVGAVSTGLSQIFHRAGLSKDIRKK